MSEDKKEEPIEWTEMRPVRVHLTVTASSPSGEADTRPATTQDVWSLAEYRALKTNYEDVLRTKNEYRQRASTLESERNVALNNSLAYQRIVFERDTQLADAKARIRLLERELEQRIPTPDFDQKYLPQPTKPKYSADAPEVNHEPSQDVFRVQWVSEGRLSNVNEISAFALRSWRAGFANALSRLEYMIAYEAGDLLVTPELRESLGRKARDVFASVASSAANELVKDYEVLPPPVQEAYCRVGENAYRYGHAQGQRQLKSELRSKVLAFAASVRKRTEQA